MNLTILKDSTVEYDIQIEDALASLSRMIDNFIRIVGKDGVFEIDDTICQNVSCMRCPFVGTSTACGRGVLPKKYRLSHLKQIYQYIQNGYKELYSVDVNEVL